MPDKAAKTIGRAGEPIFLHYDQAGLDRAYDQYVFAPNGHEVIARYGTESTKVRSRIGNPRRMAYGPTAIEAVDIYPAGSPGAPIFVFIHGGAWRSGASANYGFAAEMFGEAGVNYVAVDFVSVVDAGGDISAMVDQVRRALAWVFENAHEFGGDTSRFYIGGHSSGGHLAGMCLITDWASDHGLPPDMIKGALCSSGIYDMKPIRLGERSSYIKLDDASEEALSVQRHLQRIRCPVIVSVGTLESPEFKRQAHEFATGLRAHGQRVDEVVAEGYNHFEILETLRHPNGALGSAVLRLMGLR